MSKKLKIGIPVQNIDGVIGVRDDMVRFASEFGDISLIHEYVDVDVIFLPGGPDINPARYGEKPGWWAYRPDPLLEYFDTKVLPKYLGKIPVVGICRGLQVINVAYGGTLKQHLFFHRYSKEDNDLVHTIFRSPPGGETFDVFAVNSFHHQCIDKFGRGITPIGHSMSCYEAIKGRKIFAVQWHPERMYTQDDGFYDLWTIKHIESLLGIGG